MLKRLTAFVCCLFLVSGCAYGITPISSVPAVHTGGLTASAANTQTAAPPQEPLPSPEETVREVTVHFINVGHGDCILIQAGRENMLIDSGMPRFSEEVIDYLKKCGVQELDKVLITHPHIDHIGGLADIIQAFPIGELIMTTVPNRDLSYDDAMDAIWRKSLNVTHPKVGDRFQLANAILTVLAPRQHEYKDLNNTSVVTRLTFGETSMLLTGDASAESEQEMLANDKTFPLWSTLLKCGHHGGISSTSQAFLDAVKPQYAVISCGKKEGSMFPAKEVLDRLKAMGVKVYRTDESGTITVVSDGKKLEIH